MGLTGKIHQVRKEIDAWARDYGLDYFETIFEMVDAHQLSEIVAYGGFPTRYPHWRFGMEFDHIIKGTDYGLHKIYELVINNDPCYAYLLECNSLVDQKIVIAHVYGHCDFFKNNAWFQQTDRNMIDVMGNHASKIRYFGEKVGEEAVEQFIDTCLSIEDLINVYHPFTKDCPSKKEKDIFGYLIEHAPLAEWERDILKMVYREAYYFMPQRQTKIMNEGWASYWHSKILTEKALGDADVIDFADHHAGTLVTQPGQINPYKLGIELFREIEDRWNKGRFGEEYERCGDLKLKMEWDRKLGKGLAKIFEVRKLYNDVMFIDEFLTEEFCAKQKLFVYAFNKRNGTYEIVDRDYRKVKEKLLFSLTHFGLPLIYVTDGNYQGKGQLLLTHEHEGVDLKVADAKATLERIHAIWKKPIHLETRLNGEKRVLIFTGQEHQERAV